jgi:hypothetical protein
MIPDDWSYIEDLECPNCVGKFLHAEAWSLGEPTGAGGCLMCGWKTDNITRTWNEDYERWHEEQRRNASGS